MGIALGEMMNHIEKKRADVHCFCFHQSVKTARENKPNLTGDTVSFRYSLISLCGFEENMTRKDALVIQKDCNTLFPFIGWDSVAKHVELTESSTSNV